MGATLKQCFSRTWHRVYHLQQLSYKMLFYNFKLNISILWEQFFLPFFRHKRLMRIFFKNISDDFWTNLVVTKIQNLPHLAQIVSYRPETFKNRYPSLIYIQNRPRVFYSNPATLEESVIFTKSSFLTLNQFYPKAFLPQPRAFSFSY